MVALDLVIKHHKGRRIEISGGDVFEDPIRAEALKRELSNTEWTVLKVHDGHRGFSKMLESGASLAIYSFRDVRDVVYSLMHKKACSFQQLVVNEAMLYKIIDNDEFWRAQNNILVQRYETILAKPEAAIEEIAYHLKIKIKESEVDRLTKAYSLESNRERVLRHADRLRQKGVDLDDPQNAEIQNPVTHLHWNHIRNGEVGAWKRIATSEETSTLNDIAGNWLKMHGYELDSIQPNPKEQ